MGKYVEKNLMKGERVILKAKINKLALLPVWLNAIIFCWLIYPVIAAIISTVRIFCIDLALTNKRCVGKFGVIATSSLDTPLNKLNGVNAERSFWGRIFNYGDVCFQSSGGNVQKFTFIKNCEGVKQAILAQAEQYEEDRVKQQAEEMAKAMASAMAGAASDKK